ncbi:MAG: neuraminidase-like domain-containing protein, partial [Acidobacteriota bacterium]
WESLGTVFALAKDPATDEAALLDEIGQKTGWNQQDVEFLDGASGFDFVFPAAYQDEQALRKLRDAFGLLKRLGVSAEQAFAWIGEEITEAQGRAAKQAAAAKYDSDEWLTRAKPLRDVLREKQRAALVDYLVHRPGAGQQWEDANDLYAHFLIDVEMTPCMMTSRIKQAILSTQLFVQRCFLNLEKDVEADAEADHNWSQWNRWMKNYRVWEANRKIFLWPENWIMPEFRDAKSPFFTELENELLQTDITNDSAETAFKNYLEKLDVVARLEVVGMYHQVEKDKAGQIAVDHLHVVARTHSVPHQYYYRRRTNGESWTAWERIDLEIEGDQVIPVIWNRRLHLIWPFFTEFTKDTSVTMPATDSKVPEPARYLKIQLQWSEYKNGQWSAPRISEENAESDKPWFVEWLKPEDNFFFRAIFEGNDLVIRAYRSTYLEETHYDVTTFEVTYQKLNQYVKPIMDFRFAGCDGLPRLEEPPEDAPRLAVPKDTMLKDTVFTELVRRYLSPVLAGDRLYLMEGDITYQLSPGPYSTGSLTDKTDILTLNQTPGYFSLVAPHQDPQFNSTRSFFYQDRLRTYHV